MSETFARGTGGRPGGAPAVAVRNRRAIVMGLLLLVALVAVVVSWRLTQSPRQGAVRGDYAGRSRQLLAETEQVTASIQKRQSDDAVAMSLDGLDARRQVETAVVADAAAVAPEAATSLTFRVRGVVTGGARPLAFIDEQTVGIGETIQGFTVIAIAGERVTFRDPSGKTRSVGVYGE